MRWFLGAWGVGTYRQDDTVDIRSVLEAELTYALSAGDIETPAKHAADALRRLSDPVSGAILEHLALHAAATRIATQLVRAVANLETTGRADDGSFAGSDSLSSAVDRLVREIADKAEQIPGSRRGESPVDRTGRYLCESLRVPVDPSALDGLSQEAPAGPRHHALHAGRRAWMALATRQFAIASQLDAELPELWYKRQFGSLSHAISEGAANLLRGGRLLLRTDAFRHRRAWGTQGVALSHAIEACIRALRGEEASYAQTQLIVMTRLLRATTAIVTIDAQRQNLTFGTNRRARR